MTGTRAWTVVACLAFVFATLYALAVVVLRLPFNTANHGSLFRTALVLHVELAVFVWLMATMAGQWAAALGPHASRWPAFAAGAATVLLALSPLAGGTAVMADYFPWLAGNAWFAGSFALFCGAIIAAALEVLRGPIRAEWRGVELAAWPTLAAGATLLADAANGAVTPAQLAWGAGHVLLFAHVLMLCRDWSFLAGVPTRLLSRTSIGLVAIAAVLPLTALVWAPGTPEHEQAFTWAMAWLLWPLPLLLGAQAFLRLWGMPRPLSLVRFVVSVSFVLLVAGCLIGAAIDGPTTLVTAHYHAAIGAVAVSRMGVAYLSAPTTAFAVPSWTAARRQLAIYVLGLILLSAGLALAAIEGAPRKTSAGELSVKGSYFAVGMSISGVGGLLATVGAGWLVINLLRRRPPADPCKPQRQA